MGAIVVTGAAGHLGSLLVRALLAERHAARALVHRSALEGVDCDAVIVNPTAMICPDDHGPSEIGRFVQRLLDRTMPGLVAAGFDWVDARDVAAQLVRLMRGPRGRYILAGQRASLPELAKQVCAHGGVAAPRMISPLWPAKATAPVAVGWARLRGTPPLYTPASLATLGHYRVVDGGLARRELGWAPRPLAETIADAVAWWRRR